MVLTALQITAFFEAPAQMGVPNCSVVKLREEGMNNGYDLHEFTKETIAKVASNLCCPGGREPNSDPSAPQGSTIATQPFVFSAKSQELFVVAAELLQYYKTVGWTVTTANI